MQIPNTKEQVQGKTVCVLGMERSGQAACTLLVSMGANVVAYDRKTAEELKLGADVMSLPGLRDCMGQPIEQALSGVDFCVYSPGIPLDAPDLQAVRALGLPLIGEMTFASYFAACPLLALTGTNGKTTTASLLQDMLSKQGISALAAGNIGYPLSAAVQRLGRDGAIALEVSSFQLEASDGFAPKVACVLNVTPDHLNRHRTMACYVETKMRIFANMSPDGAVVLNYDDVYCRQMAAAAPCKVLWFSLEEVVTEGAYYRDGYIICAFSGQTERVLHVDEMKLQGMHNVQNAMAAVLMALHGGVSMDSVRESLRSFRSVEHRLEDVAIVRGVQYINDSKATNPESTEVAVKAMKKRTVLILGGSEKGTPFDRLSRLIAAHSAIAHVVLLGQTSRQIRAALEECGFDRMTQSVSLRDAVEKATDLCNNGDVVLLSPACASFDMFKSYEDRGRQFKQIVLALSED